MPFLLVFYIAFLKTPIITGTNKLSVQQIKTEIEKKMRMPGWILADPEIIKKIDDSSNFIKVRLNKIKMISPLKVVPM